MADENEQKAAEQVEEVVDSVKKVGETVGFFAAGVTYKEGATEEEIEAARPFVENFTKELATGSEDHMPLCIEQLAIRRVHD